MHHFDWLTGALFPYINFAIFLFVLVKFAKKPLQDAMRSRREQFTDIMEAANKAKEAAQAQNQELASKLENLENELEKMRQSAVNSAKQDAEHIIANAEKLAELIKVEARNTIETEMLQARQNLQKEIVEQAIQLVKKKAVTEVTPKQHGAFVQTGITSLQEAKAGVK